MTHPTLPGVKKVYRISHVQVKPNQTCKKDKWQAQFEGGKEKKGRYKKGVSALVVLNPTQLMCKDLRH